MIHNAPAPDDFPDPTTLCSRHLSGMAGLAPVSGLAALRKAAAQKRAPSGQMPGRSHIPDCPHLGLTRRNPGDYHAFYVQCTAMHDPTQTMPDTMAPSLGQPVAGEAPTGLA